MNAAEIYAGSDAELTKRFYAALELRGPIGVIAVNLFRAQKASARAKVYRGGIRGKGSFRGMAYDRKQWALGQLVETLKQHFGIIGIGFGWKEDPRQEWNPWVLYVDLPQGQVSFHSPTRLEGPDYAGEFDGAHKSAERIIEFCDAVLGGSEPRQIELLQEAKS